MIIFIFASLLISLGLITAFLLLRDKLSSSKKRKLVIGAVSFYAIFILLAAFYYIHRPEPLAVAGENKAIEGAKERRGSLYKIEIEVAKDVFEKLEVGKATSIKLTITNKSELELTDLQMSLSETFKDFCKVTGVEVDNYKVKYSERVSMGSLDLDQEKTVKLDLLPQRTGKYEGEIFWLLNNTEVLEGDTPLVTVLKFNINEDLGTAEENGTIDRNRNSYENREEITTPSDDNSDPIIEDSEPVDSNDSSEPPESVLDEYQQ